MNAVPPRPAVGVGAVVFDQMGRVLLVRRGKAPRQGLWSLPGGCLENGETMPDCCRREILEETGIGIEPGPIVAVVQRIAEGFHYLIIDFLARPSPRGPAADPVPASDASAARWVELDRLTDYHLVEGVDRVILNACRLVEADMAAGLVDADGRERDFLVRAVRTEP